MSAGGVVFAAMYDRIMAGTETAGLREHRSNLISQARGDVLEVGAGTGANLPFYTGAVDTLTMTEPEPAMVRRLQRRVDSHPSRVLLLRAPAENLPFGDDSFDTAVATLALCTVNDQPRALRELWRVLRPGGRLLFIEHVRSTDPRLARWQDRMNPVNRIVAHGCNCNRPTVEALDAAGFSVLQIEHGGLPKAPPFARPLVVGVAEVI